ncbi:TlyA family RNA methyltransferase [Curtobacterium sp. L6-1]|uniref:TlyA family RNA methyltransferase n=1 Tax=Curtobacterium aetherium TaxID=2841594 RepID=A0ACD1E469_9MICO|nr:TlyA family RNA methyltransferase [Curtobacterium sp. L6-1]
MNCGLASSRAATDVIEHDGSSRGPARPTTSSERPTTDTGPASDAASVGPTGVAEADDTAGESGRGGPGRDVPQSADDRSVAGTATTSSVTSTSTLKPTSITTPGEPTSTNATPTTTAGDPTSTSTSTSPSVDATSNANANGSATATATATAPAPATGTARLDSAVAARGLARSRTAAAALVQAGRVTVDGSTIVKPSTQVSASADITVDTADEWVSRAALKLVAALDTFDLDPSGRTVLDVGASTGGFTQVLLARGAARVIALDVGHGQLAPVVALDDRVAVVEGVNARNLTPADYLALDPAASDTALVVGDLSFISLRLVLPALVASVPADDFVLLVKPQFEVGRTGIREGIVRDASLRQDALMNVLWAAWDLGLGTAGLAASPILGTHGNHEYLARLQRGGGENPTEWIVRATELAEGAP